MKNKMIFTLLKPLFFGLIVVAASSVLLVSADSKEPLLIVDTLDLPVCDIETLENL